MNTGHNTKTEEDAAALVLLRSTGLGVLEAAQVITALVRRIGEAALPIYEAEQEGAGGGKGLMRRCMEIVEWGVEAAEARERTVSFEEAGWASVEARKDLRTTTRRDLRYYLRKFLKMEGIAEQPLRSMSTAQCRELLQKGFGHSKSSYAKARAILHSIFAYGIRMEWSDANPVARIEAPNVPETPKEPLPLEDVARLQEVAEQEEHRDMKLSLNLMLYSGIRPAEVSRLREEDFCWQEGVVIIRPHKSKTGGGRVVPLRGVHKLRPQEKHIPRNWQQRWQALRRAAGFTHWVPDVCRHTFATYHAAHFRNLPELQLEMGHRDLTLLRTRYMSPAQRLEAGKFWKSANIRH